MTAEDKKLHATAKEFVPSWLNATTKPAPAKSATSAAKKTPESSSSSGKDNKDTKKTTSSPSMNGSTKATPKPSTTASKPSTTTADKTKPTSAETVKKDAVPQPPPKAAAPPVSAWGSKVSESVKKAAPIKPQQSKPKPAPQKQQSGGNGKPGNASQRQQSNGKRGGDKNNTNNNRSNSGRNNNTQQQKPTNAPQQQKPTNTQQQKPQQQGGGGGGGGWASIAAKPAKPQPASQPQRQQSSGGNNNNNNNNNNRDNNNNRGGQNNNNNHRYNNNNRQQSHHRNYDRSNSRGGGGGDQRNNDNDPNWSRGKAVPRDLLEPGEGETDAEKAVSRINVETLLDMRLRNLNPPSSWEEEDCETKPSQQCLWDTPTREEDIKVLAAADRIGGDVTRMEKKKKKPNPHDTAPALEDCKPLEVNEETRWKAKVMDDTEGGEASEEDSKEEILRKATLILNKLSLTKFDKLSDEFIACGIGKDVETLTGAVSLIVTYAQEQQHFSAMYAGLCLKLANTPMEGIDEGLKKGKKFKKILLGRCQEEFDTDPSTKIKEATKDITDEELIEYHSTLIKKHYLGHMRFIGELYKGDLISIKIMLFCLPMLLHGDKNDTASEEVDEEKLECFSKLMTVIGSSLEQQSAAMKSVGKADAANSLAECWKTVEIMAGKRKEKGPKVSNRIKFMLQDLLEMRQKGWVSRRKEETAKTLAQIHKEVAKEERASARKSNSRGNLSKSRHASSGDVRQLDKAQAKPQVDADGFVSVAPHRSASMTALHKSQSKEGFHKRGSTVGLDDVQQRVKQGSKFAVLNEKNNKKGSNNKLADKAQAPAENPTKSKVDYLSPDECGDKAKNILKEYFVGGDADDAVLSIHELVGIGDEGSVKRGTKVVESGVLKVLEMKQGEVDKFVSIYLRCAKEKKIECESFVLGLNDPLEFLNDVAIDAPLAVPHLACIVAEFVKADVIPFNFLLNTPAYFRSDQNAASFGAKVMKKIGGEATTSEDYIEVIGKLMTDDDKTKYTTVGDLIDAA